MRTAIVRARDVMSSPALEVAADDTVRRAAELLSANGIGALVVTDQSGAVGMVSERDVVRTIAEGLPPDDTWVAEVMAEQAYLLAPEDTLEDVVASMADHWVRHLPVIDDEGLVCGLVSVRDVLLALVDEDRL